MVRTQLVFGSKRKLQYFILQALAAEVIKTIRDIIALNPIYRLV